MVASSDDESRIIEQTPEEYFAVMETIWIPYHIPNSITTASCAKRAGNQIRSFAKLSQRETVSEMDATTRSPPHYATRLAVVHKEYGITNQPPRASACMPLRKRYGDFSNAGAQTDDHRKIAGSKKFH